MSNNNNNVQPQLNITDKMVEDENNALTDYEAALYDRGIRVWGVDAQNRLRRSRVLFIGISGLSAEIAKNVALAGVGNITVIDNTTVTNDDIGLFINGDQSIGKTRSEAAVLAIEELNPLINVRSDSRSLDSIDAEYIKAYTLVCIDSLDSSIQLRINNLCRFDNVSFILTHCFGLHGYFFSDLGNSFKYAIKQKVKVNNSNNNKTDKNEEPEEKEELIEKISSFSSLNDSLSVQWNSLPNRLSPLYFILSVLYQYQQSHNKTPTFDDLNQVNTILENNNQRYNISPNNKHSELLKQTIQHLHSELPPVCAILGGIVGQEIVKIISRDNEVINNYFFFDGPKSSGLVELIHPKH